MLLNEYIFDVVYYNEYEDKDVHCYGLVMAENQKEALIKISDRLPNIGNLVFTSIFEQDFVWLNKKNYDLLSEIESEYMLDQDDEKIE